VSTIRRASRHNLPLITTQGCSWMGWKSSTGSVPLHGSDDISLRICIGRTAPEISVRCNDITVSTASALTLAQLLVPLPPTSEKPVYSVAYRAHVHLLDNDSLLQIFTYYRLEHEDSWNTRFTWRKLTHVCRRWRYLIYDSSSLLNLCLLLTANSLSIVTLSHLPPLPLILDYWDKTTTMARKDEDNIHLGLQQNGHVLRVALRAPRCSAAAGDERPIRAKPRNHSCSYCPLRFFRARSISERGRAAGGIEITAGIASIVNRPYRLQ